MNPNELIKQQYRAFEDAAHDENGVEFWYARELQLLLGYRQWRDFNKVIQKAIRACRNSEYDPDDQFVHARKLIVHGKEAQREILEFKLTRYACYLIAQNGDPRKNAIAFAQTYFAVQTRRIEVLEQRMKDEKRIEARRKLRSTENKLGGLVYERGVNNQGFGRLRSKGDKALFGGFNTAQMKERLNVPEKRPLADFLPTVSIKAKDLASEITRVNVEERDIYGENAITGEHVQSNKSVRTALVNRNIYPEILPPDEDIKKVERRVAKSKKSIKEPAKEIGSSQSK